MKLAVMVAVPPMESVSGEGVMVRVYGAPVTVTPPVAVAPPRPYGSELGSVATMLTGVTVGFTPNTLKVTVVVLAGKVTVAGPATAPLVPE